ncbi:MAG: hypothetical protein ACIAQZ_03850 [Sedimentisphaeraceae bacterium JB056]
MSVEFTKQQWDKIKTDSNKWWKGELGRPLLQVRLNDPAKEKSKYSFQSFYPLDEPASVIVDDWEKELDSTLHLGDAFPHIWPNFGPGCIAAFMGADLVNGQETAWFHPKEDKELRDLAFNYIPDNKWLIRVKDIVEEVLNRWQGGVQLGLTDLGGNLDILSTFRPSEKLLFDLYDCPDDVKKMTWEAHELWWKYFEEFHTKMLTANPGYSSWARIFSEQPHYMLQCDFCYMIGPDMFDEFVKPELAASCDKLENAFYHLDGPGELPHLDSLLEIDSLKGVQWIPGAGTEDNTNWPDVYRKISDAGKKIQIFSQHSEKPFEQQLDIIADQIGRCDNIVFMIDADISERERAKNLLEKFC